MFDGVRLQSGFSDEQARHWQRVGIDGLFVGALFTDWYVSVGEGPSSPDYQMLARFQRMFAARGVADNFLKVATVYQVEPRLDWTNAQQRSLIVNNFREGARMARYAGLKGVALDLEPYQRNLWASDPSLPGKAALVLQLGREVGAAIKAEFPDATVIVLPEVRSDAAGTTRFAENYRLSPEFWQGLMQARFRQTVIATEHSYSAPHPAQIIPNIHRRYAADFGTAAYNGQRLSIAIGIWPLGKTYTNKQAQETVMQFRQQLEESFESGQPYVWIYGQGSAWETNGPYGSAALDPQFESFVTAIHEVKSRCH